jgi:hypothetical protein
VNRGYILGYNVVSAKGVILDIAQASWGNFAAVMARLDSLAVCE